MRATELHKVMLKKRTSTATLPPSSRRLAAEMAPTQRAKRTNDPTAGFDGNTARGRRVADLVRGYLAALGNPADVGLQAQIIAAAELQVLAEEARAAALGSPGTADLDQVVKIQGAADRAVRRLGIKAGTATERVPSLGEYLARNHPVPKSLT